MFPPVSETSVRISRLLTPTLSSFEEEREETRADGSHPAAFTLRLIADGRLKLQRAPGLQPLDGCLVNVEARGEFSFPGSARILVSARGSRRLRAILRKARMTNTLIATASSLLRTLAAMSAPCSVKARGRTGENLSRLRWSQFVTTSSFLHGGEFKDEIGWKTPRIAFDGLIKNLVVTPYMQGRCRESPSAPPKLKPRGSPTGSHPTIDARILTLRGQKGDSRQRLAIYGVTTKVLNQAVKRNAGRFPADFVFELNPPWRNWRWSQIVTTSAGSGSRQFSRALSPSMARSWPPMFSTAKRRWR